MNVEIGTVPAQFLFWEYLFLIFSIGSLQCIESSVYEKSYKTENVPHVVGNIGGFTA
jgi:hypothetical protein